MTVTRPLHLVFQNSVFCVPCSKKREHGILEQATVLRYTRYTVALQVAIPLAHCHQTHNQHFHAPCSMFHQAELKALDDPPSPSFLTSTSEEFARGVGMLSVFSSTFAFPPGGVPILFSSSSESSDSATFTL